MHRARVSLALSVLVLLPLCAHAQLVSRVVASGFSQPVAIVQDPLNANVQFVVEQAGRIRILEGGHVHTSDFVDLRAVVGSGGERGLLGLVFAPNHAVNRRFFVNFTNLNGHTVVARFTRSAASPHTVELSSRFDLLWPDGRRFIEQPFSNHNGGDLQFGDDGFLYIGLGDGGSGDDPLHLAQDRGSLLGKMLRIDVSVGDGDPEGYDIPLDNPFLTRTDTLREIWAFGLRNPWRYSFDAQSRGGTGALLIGDVGQGQLEEINYEPAARGGRNYGWRLREGTLTHITTLPAAFGPLTDPVLAYPRALGQSVVGGFVYRGSELAATFRGRYFFGDFVSGRVWSAGITLAPGGEASFHTVTDHTVELSSSGLGLISAFGTNASGELFLVGYSRGEIRRVAAPPVISRVAMHIDAPAATTVTQPFRVAGWAVDLNETRSGPGVSSVHVWAFPHHNAPAQFLGHSAGGARPDIGALFGPEFSASGFSVPVNTLTDGTYDLAAYAFSTVTGRFEASRAVTVHVSAAPVMHVDSPTVGATVSGPFVMTGWAIDTSASSGTGVNAVHVWAYPASGAPIFVGVADHGGSRPDIAQIFGARFAPAGWGLTVSGLTPGAWTLVAYMHSSATGTFRHAVVVPVTVVAQRAEVTTAGWRPIGK